MDVPWYELAKKGAKECLLRLVEQRTDILESVTPLNETALHVALRHGQLDLAEELAAGHPELVEKLNAKGDTPLHLALLMGHAPFLVWWLSHIPGSVLESGNNFINKAGKSLLFLAVQTGTPEAVKALLESPLGKESGGPNNLTALHAAVFQHRLPDFETQAKEIVETLLSCSPKLSREQDSLGNTPLHYAVTLENKGLDLVKSLLWSDIYAAYILNKEGLSPIHLAASLGFVDVFQCFMELYPESGLATTTNGRNVLHISVQEGRPAMVRHILERPELRILINEKDGDGNTPLHLSLLVRNVRIQRFLEQSKELDKHAWNNEGLTYRDIHKVTKELQQNGLSDATYLSSIEVSSKNGLSDATYLPSIGANSKHGLSSATYLRSAVASPNLHGFAQMKYKTIAKVIVNTSWREKIRDTKDSANILLVVAMLITTITFAATFTVPGGFNDSGPDKGMAVLAKHVALQMFLIFDTLSMCISILAILVIVWAALLSDLSVMALTATLALDLILWAIIVMLGAFTSGLYLVIESQCRTLAITIVVIVCFTISYMFLFHEGLTNGFKHTKETYYQLRTLLYLRSDSTYDSVAEFCQKVIGFIPSRIDQWIQARTGDTTSC